MKQLYKNIKQGTAAEMLRIVNLFSDEENDVQVTLETC